MLVTDVEVEPSLIEMRNEFRASTGESLTGSTLMWAVVSSTLNVPVTGSVLVSMDRFPLGIVSFISQILYVKLESPLKSI